MSFIAGTDAPGDPIPGKVTNLAVKPDGAGAFALMGSPDGVNFYRAKVTADGEIVFSGSITIDTVEVTDVGITGTGSPDGSGTAYHLVVNSDGSINAVVLSGTVSVTPPGVPLDAVFEDVNNTTFSAGSGYRSVAFTVTAGAPTWNGITLPVGFSTSVSIDFPGDTFVAFPDLVCGADDHVLLTAVTLD